MTVSTACWCLAVDGNSVVESHLVTLSFSGVRLSALVQFGFWSMESLSFDGSDDLDWRCLEKPLHEVSMDDFTEELGLQISKLVSGRNFVEDNNVAVYHFAGGGQKATPMCRTLDDTV